MRARPLSTVAVWSLATGLLWYGFYKYLTEEELVTTTGEGPGAFLSLAPFLVGITGPGWLPLVGLGNGIEGVVGGEALAAGSALLGLAWIVGAQLRLYTAVNGVLRSAGAPASMTWWWALAPGFNIIGGIRLIHFTAVAAVLVAAAAEGGGGRAPAVASPGRASGWGGGGPRWMNAACSRRVVRGAGRGPQRRPLWASSGWTDGCPAQSASAVLSARGKDPVNWARNEGEAAATTRTLVRLEHDACRRVVGVRRDHLCLSACCFVVYLPSRAEK
eukprot:TRINITY_DN1458_c0_g1_i4.p1 TRINITY_DN1458_c0_g1~~TRINITY_DN1458_c0_g1_i4.p1  ORF type:complete len:274 (+),score=57.76 TRINITY_DN1458_c0_g1_i4:41-862(+)